MTIALVATAFALFLVGAAFAGPALLRRCAPVLVRAPRTAVALLTAALGAWILGVLAIGPMLAWALPGPSLLPDAAGRVCRRCLAAANPFATRGDAGALAAALVVAAALGAMLLAAAVLRETRRRVHATEAAAARVRAGATSRTVHGRRVLVPDDTLPYAYALPARRGGIVVSAGALAALGGEELEAVLAHEEAHLRGRHHPLMLVVGSLCRVLAWIPFARAVGDAVGQYVEIAADARAEHVAGTPALAAALLRIGAARVPGAPGLALHASGTDRIRRLVAAPEERGAGVLPTTAAAAGLALLVAACAVVAVPYLVVALRGCL